MQPDLRQSRQIRESVRILPIRFSGLSALPYSSTAPNDTPRRPLRALVVEDSEDDYQLLVALLSSAGYQVSSRRVEDAPGMHAALENSWDIVISDHRMPRFSSMAALDLLKDTLVEVPFLIVSANIGEEAAVEALHAGASDYVLKDNLHRLVPAVDRALAAAESLRARRLAELALKESESLFRAITSNLPGMVFQLHYAPQDGAVFFSYVSEGAQTLFDVPPRVFLDQPHLFLDRIRPEDRERLEPMFVERATDLAVLRWEGRLTGGEPQRWISISASPRELAPGLVWWEGIATDVTRQKLAELETHESREQLRQLSSHVEKAKEAERSRIAREIHDDVGGTLTAVKLDLAWLRGKVPKNNELLMDKIRTMQQHLDSALQSSIRIARDLRPSLLDYGIVPAIEWQLDAFRKRLGIVCELDGTSEDVELDPDLATTVFRLFQESLTNIAKHAGASEVKVMFTVTDDEVTLQVSDNGVGLAPGALNKRKSFGLRGMRERVAEFGGTLEVMGDPGRGTTLKVTLPRQTR
jgi:two-component system, NarL family, sensor histidine kinase UhpB